MENHRPPPDGVADVALKTNGISVFEGSFKAFAIADGGELCVVTR